MPSFALGGLLVQIPRSIELSSFTRFFQSSSLFPLSTFIYRSGTGFLTFGQAPLPSLAHALPRTGSSPACLSFPTLRSCHVISSITSLPTHRILYRNISRSNKRNAGTLPRRQCCCFHWNMGFALSCRYVPLHMPFCNC